MLIAPPKVQRASEDSKPFGSPDQSSVRWMKQERLWKSSEIVFACSKVEHSNPPSLGIRVPVTGASVSRVDKKSRGASRWASEDRHTVRTSETSSAIALLYRTRKKSASMGSDCSASCSKRGQRLRFSGRKIGGGIGNDALTFPARLAGVAQA